MISIIVPIYNAEKYLRRCVDSILVQSYVDFELLLIDDGSPDGSGAICDEYMALDARVRVFHKVNGGVSSARNLGMEQAQGEWITFVDSDDWVEKNYLEDLIANSDADFVLSGFVGIPSGQKILADALLYERTSIKNFIKRHQDDLLRGPCGDLLKLSLIKNNDIRFDTRIRYGEDTVFNYQYLYYCSRVRTISSCNYNYFHEPETEGKSLTQRKYNLSLDEAEYALNKLIETKNKLNKRIPYDIEDNLSIDIYTFVNVCSVVCMADEVYLENYFRFCQTITPELSLTSFYSSELYSPIFRGIAELKGLYIEKRYEEAKALYIVLNKILQNVPKIDFRCKDFYLWNLLIKNRKYKVLDLLLKFYAIMKNIN